MCLISFPSKDVPGLADGIGAGVHSPGPLWPLLPARSPGFRERDRRFVSRGFSLLSPRVAREEKEAFWSIDGGRRSRIPVAGSLVSWK